MKFCDFYLGNKLIAKKVKYCDTFRLKLVGLMFVKSPGNGAYLPGVRDIHMNFVRFKLRIVWLDENLKVVDSKIAKTWRLYYGSAGAENVLELPLDNNKKIKNGDKLRIKIYESSIRKNRR